jgi:hypothetical protein
VTLSLYRVTETQQLAFLTELTRDIFVPWRPLSLPNGQPYPLNGYAFRAQFDFPKGITLPEKVLALVSFNTQNTGFRPIHVQGPYNELNIAVSSVAPTVGSDADPGAILKVAYDTASPAGLWSFPNASLGNDVPMFRLRALSTQSRTSPTLVGSYEVSANISDSSYAGRVLGTLTIRPSFQSWIEGKIASGQIPPDAAGEQGDPDRDGIPNLMEYAFNLDPAVAAHFNSSTSPACPKLELKNGGVAYTYRRNLDATDLSYAIEHSATLTEPGPWPTITGSETILSDDGHTRLVEIQLPRGSNENRRFYRLRINR